MTVHVSIRLGSGYKRTVIRALKPNLIDSYWPGEDLADDEFDVLGWWKSSSSKYPVLSEIALNVLAIPISTLGSESAFNIEGRFLDPFHNALSMNAPKAVEALICTRSWLTSTPAPVVFLDYMDDWEKYEEIEFELLEECILEDDPQKD